MEDFLPRMKAAVEREQNQERAFRILIVALLIGNICLWAAFVITFLT